VIFYFFLCLANMLKTSSHKLLEASAYLTAAVVAAALTLGTHSLNAALVAASVTLATFTFFGVKDVRRAVTF
jgi:tryptophan synthase beta subunit